MNPRVVLLILVSIVLGAGGQLLFKAATRGMPGYADLGLLKLLVYMFTSPYILFGFASFFISAVLWIVALRGVALNIAYPMVALSYVIIFLGSHVLFGEPLSWRHWLGALLIVSGIALIAWRH